MAGDRIQLDPLLPDRSVSGLREGLKQLVLVSRLGSDFDVLTLDPRRRERATPKARAGPFASVSVNPGGLDGD
jgi:hypothetical protein